MSDPTVGQFVSRAPLSDHERLLIRAAETQLWNWELRQALALAVHHRGAIVGRYENCGDLADFLALLGSED